MFHDARTLPAGTTLAADLCIVGAGAAGITLAHALRGRGLRVLLLESGGMELEEATQALYQGEQRGVKMLDLDASRLRYFGGTTNHWAGWCRPLEASDFRPADPADPRRWPIAREDLTPYYAAAHTVLGLAHDRYAPDDPLLDRAGLAPLKLDPQRLRTALFQLSGARFGPQFQPELAAAPGVDVWLHANLLELQTDATASQVTALRAASLGGAVFTVTARLFVLAAGGLENARLLLLSNQTQPAGLGNTYDLVGRYFMDHPWLADLGYLAFNTPGRDLRLYLDQTETPTATLFGTLAPATAEPGIGGFRVLLRPSRRIIEGVAALKSIGSDIAALRWPRHLWANLGHAVSDYDAVIDSAYKTAFGTRRGLFGAPEPMDAPIVGAHLDVNVEQLPNRDNRVTLSRSRDALGQNRIVLDWRPGADEKRTMRRAAELVGLEMGRLGIGRLRVNPLGDADSWPADLQASRHHLGTTRMADSPRAGVVDAQCRVHGIANLYIAGSSVFASAGYANPTLTIVALALRLADTLARELG
ncbi:MAG: GMC family oxidoreductase [Acetobacteraceae bacterium]|nr:GMC family oxidoreductase [Acetobacteraceae bacterium]